jgi:hypothetical protein
MKSGGEAEIEVGNGIPEEEQREILAQIDEIAEMNRLAFSASADEERFKAKKSGRLLPALVNAFAALALAAGFAGLTAAQGAADARAREGARLFNGAERALISEIRRETGASLEAADREIEEILALLGEIEARMMQAAPAARAMGEDGGADGEALAQIMAEHAEALAALDQARAARTLILDEARAEEADLQARRDARERPAGAGFEPAAGTARAGFDAGEELSEEEELRAWREARDLERALRGSGAGQAMGPAARGIGFPGAVEFIGDIEPEPAPLSPLDALAELARERRQAEAAQSLLAIAGAQAAAGGFGAGGRAGETPPAPFEEPDGELSAQMEILREVMGDGGEIPAEAASLVLSALLADPENRRIAREAMQGQQ